MNPILKFLVAPAGRTTRALAGFALIAGGLLVVGGPAGVLVAVVGAVPLLAGSFDLCVFAPLFGHSVNGAKTRAAA